MSTPGSILSQSNGVLGFLSQEDGTGRSIGLSTSAASLMPSPRFRTNSKSMSLSRTGAGSPLKTVLFNSSAGMIASSSAQPPRSPSSRNLPIFSPRATMNPVASAYHVATTNSNFNLYSPPNVISGHATAFSFIAPPTENPNLQLSPLWPPESNTVSVNSVSPGQLSSVSPGLAIPITPAESFVHSGLAGAMQSHARIMGPAISPTHLLTATRDPWLHVSFQTQRSLSPDSISLGQRHDRSPPHMSASCPSLSVNTNLSVIPSLQSHHFAAPLGLPIEDSAINSSSCLSSLNVALTTVMEAHTGGVGHGLASPRRGRLEHHPSSLIKQSPGSLRGNDSSRQQIQLQPKAQIKIGQFYFPRGIPMSPPSRQSILDQIYGIFAQYDTEAIPCAELHTIIKTILHLPSYLSGAMYLQLRRYHQINLTHGPANANSSDPEYSNAGEYGLSAIPLDLFLQYWHAELENMDPVCQMFQILKSHGQDYLSRANFLPLVQEVVDGHPGLEFLEHTPEFQQRYIQTVISRVFLGVNRSSNERMTLGELRKSDFMDILHSLDGEDDINKIRDYFSYEHFYVLYVKFWELDTDHDFFLTRQDLDHYSDGALTACVLDRVMQQIPRRFLTQLTSQSVGSEPGSLGPPPGQLMSFEDFVVFMMCEEDKETDSSKDYWFRLLDLDSDGVLSRSDLAFFFDEQKLRMELMAQESIAFDDIYCQLVDMLIPLDGLNITRRDVRRSKIASFAINMLVNLGKFIRHEQRDVAAVERERAFPNLSEWDRFAIGAYYLLSSEDDQPPQHFKNESREQFESTIANAAAYQWPHNDVIIERLQVGENTTGMSKIDSCVDDSKQQTTARHYSSGSTQWPSLEITIPAEVRNAGSSDSDNAVHSPSLPGLALGALPLAGAVIGVVDSSGLIGSVASHDGTQQRTYLEEVAASLELQDDSMYRLPPTASLGSVAKPGHLGNNYVSPFFGFKT